MKRAALSLMLSFAVAGSLYAAQAQSPQSQPAAPAAAPAAPAAQAPAPQAPSPSAPAGQDRPAAAAAAADITLTGCLIQGSGPTVFVLEDAKASTAAAGDKGKSYVVVVTGNADLKPHLNHQVRIVGAEAAAGAAAAPGGQAEARASDEAGFPRLTARTVTMVANTCPA
jgi:pyruvate dehydrogenase E2 component (dihydrolipoamide acetyltransferase)